MGLFILLLPIEARALSPDVPTDKRADSISPAGQPSKLPAAAPVETPADDRETNLIQTAEGYFAEGEKALKAGDIEKARDSFDAAVDLLLNSQIELDSSPALKAYFDSLLDKIYMAESAYLRESALDGKGPVDQQLEPALIDEIEAVDVFPLRVDPRLRDLVDADLAKTIYDVPVVINDSVLRFINYFQTQARKKFETGLVRASRYRKIIEKIFEEEGVPRDLMYMALVESTFNPLAYSRARAKGIWQFMSSTARIYNLRVGKFIDERSDPEKSTRAAARHIKKLYSMFGDWHLVMAGYNLGEGHILRAIERGGTGNFWELAEKQLLPRETQNHVPATLASIIIARNPEKYGFTVKPEPSLSYEKVTLPAPINLRALARSANMSVEELKQLNPHLPYLRVPASYSKVQVNLPVGKKRSVLAALRNGSRSRRPTSMARMASAKAGSRPRTQHAARRAPAARSKNGTPSALAASASARRLVHRVKKGDSLHRIASKYNTTVESVRNWNKLSPSEKIYPGDKLTIYLSR